MKSFVIDSGDFFCGVSKGVCSFYSYFPMFFSTSCMIHVLPGLFFQPRSEKIEFCHASGIKKSQKKNTATLKGRLKQHMTTDQW